MYRYYSHRDLNNTFSFEMEKGKCKRVDESFV